MGKPLDAMTFDVTKRYGAWTDGVWVPEQPTLTVEVDGDPTPVSSATVSDVSRFVVGESAEFITVAGVSLGVYEITAVVSSDLQFAAGSLAFDAAIGTAVLPVYELEASRPQPAGAELLDFLDEGARSTARFVIYAEDSEPTLHLIERGTADRSPDTVAYNGDVYKATSDDKWKGMPLGYRAYILLEYAADEARP
jgi:hypothetical protein